MWRNTSFAVPPVKLPVAVSTVQLSLLPLNFKPLERVRFAVLSSTNIPPPRSWALLPVMVHFSRVNVEFWNARPPPLLLLPVAALLLMVQLVIELSALLMANMPPPSPPHVLPLMVLLPFIVMVLHLMSRPPPELLHLFPVIVPFSI